MATLDHKHSNSRKPITLARVVMLLGCVFVGGSTTHPSEISDDLDIVLAGSQPDAAASPLSLDRAKLLVGWNSRAALCAHTARIGIIDAAVDLDHPDLSGAELTAKEFVTKGIASQNYDHGTFVARMLVGGKAGLTPNAKLFAANIFQIAGENMRARDGDFLRAVDWMIKQKVDVINVSLVTQRKSAIVEFAIKKAIGRGIAVVAAAGNEGQYSKPSYPAAFKDVIAVTAIDARKNLYFAANHGSYVDFAAPGVGLLVDGESKSGTSFAAPFITAQTAYRKSMRMKNHQSSALALTTALAESAQDLGQPGRDDSFGWGLPQFGGGCGMPSNDQPNG
jgi:hypothetical protein